MIRLRYIRDLAAATLLLGLCGCATSSMRSGKEAMAAGDPATAYEYFRRGLNAAPDHPELQDRLREAGDQAARQHDLAIDAHLEAGDLPAARLDAEFTVYYAPENESYRANVYELHTLQHTLQEKMYQAEKAVLKKDWVRGREILEPVRSFGETYPHLATLWDRIAKENHRIAMREGLRYFKLFDYATSADYYADAVFLLPDDPEARERMELAQNREKARTLANQAREALEQGRPREAAAQAKQAAGLTDSPTRFVQATLLESLRQAARDFMEKEQEAYHRGDLRTCLALLQDARKLDVPQRTLREQIETRHDRISRELAAAYLQKGLNMETKGLHGGAAGYYYLASLLHEGFAGVDASLKRTVEQMEEEWYCDVVVLPPKMDRKRVDPHTGKHFVKAVVNSMNAVSPEGVRFYQPQQLDGNRIKENGRVPDMAIRANIPFLMVTPKTPEIEEKEIRYISGYVPELNPDMLRGKAMQERVQQELPHAIQQRDKAEADFNRASENVNPNMTNQARIELAALSLAMAAGYSRVNQLERQQAQALSLYLDSPPYIEVPKFRNYRFEVTWFEVDVEGKANVWIHDFRSGTDSEPVTVQEVKHLKDALVAAYPKAGIEANPMEIGDRETLVQKMCAELSTQTAQKFKDFRGLRRTFLKNRVNAARQAKDKDRELHYLLINTMTALWSDSEIQDLEARIGELTGLSPDGKSFTIHQLPPVSAVHSLQEK